MHDASENSIRAQVRSQWLYACGFFGLGLGFLFLFATAGHSRLHGLLGLLPVVCGLGLLSYSVHGFKAVHRRRHGLRVEARAIARATKILQAHGLTVTTNVRMRGRGDIDMVVGINFHLMPVEIKSYESWGNATAGRYAATLAQVGQAQRHLCARRGYVWLPEAKVGLVKRWYGQREGDVTVVFGGANHLARIIARQAR
jgi:hypothetical protein